ncbi:PIN domain-containing protein [Luteitalea sp. TBR-22]|uniref:PIN domain-containing protein n=1 Tax=Luteitalea sp. TBR-22 TaxID=2802971 RepID=UPI001EF73D19|nr:PIN domain-containing protein [Luteitalea sp. TBR-22]
MIYVDTSVVLAQLLDEERQPPTSLWQDVLVTSRLTHFEAWNRLHAARLGTSHGDLLRGVLATLATVELHPLATARALEPFPTPVRTLDALHLSAIEYLRSQQQEVTLATYDDRMAAAAKKLKIPLALR